MELPCVVGYTLEEGERILREHGAGRIELVETAPPGKVKPVGPARIVRQRLRDVSCVELVWAHERYARD